MKRLITFGCSHTFGEGLQNPQEESWPFKLSKLFNLDLINLSEGGASNRLLQHKIFNFNFDSDDLVIILWTYADRYHFLTSQKDTSPLINAWSKHELAEKWYKYFHNEYNQKFDNQTIVNQVNLFLKEKNLKTYNMLVSNQYSYFYQKTNLSKLDINFENDYLLKYERSSDGWHMGSEGHEILARDIYKRITKKSLL